MAEPAFDTHRAVKRLEGAGFNGDQAEAVVDAIGQASRDRGNYATKADLAALGERFDAKLEGLEAKLEGLEAKLEAQGDRFDAKLEAQGDRFDAKLSGLEQRLTVKLYTAVVLIAGMVTALDFLIG